MLPKRRSSAHLFAALGDETRLRLISRLSREGPMSITRLTAGSRVTRQAITKHLRVNRAGFPGPQHPAGTRTRLAQLQPQRLEERAATWM